MADLNSMGGLKWVNDEISASLQRVRAWLEPFIEQGGRGGGDLPDAITALQEVHGVLSSLQLSGPARLSEEMQNLCEGLSTESVANVREATEALMLALIQLPDYLDKLQAGQPDAPLALLPSINDLRHCRGASPLSEAELLVPPSVMAGTETPAPEAQKSLSRVASKIRPHFHRYLLHWFRDEPGRAGLVNLGRLFHQLRRYIPEGIFHELFLVAEAVVQAMLDGTIDANARNRALIARLDRVIRPLAEDGGAWPEADSQALLFDLLALVAECESSSYLVGELRSAYDLENGVVPQEVWAPSSAASPGAETRSARALIAKAGKELAPIRDLLGLFVWGEREGGAQLLELEPKLRSLANSLVVTGADELVDRLRRCANELGAMGRGSIQADDPHLKTVSDELLAVEMELGELDAAGARGSEGELDRHATGSEVLPVPKQPVPGAHPLSGEPVGEMERIAQDEPQDAAMSGPGIDPELLDIFLEEAEEEEQAIRTQFSLWREDERDETALSALRSSFQSLKGTGQLVGAQHTAELASAAESLLDRVIDGTLVRSSAIFLFLEEAVGVLPHLISSEADGRTMDIADLVGRAEALTLADPQDVDGPANPKGQAPPHPPAKVIPWPVAGRSQGPGAVPREGVGWDAAAQHRSQVRGVTGAGEAGEPKSANAASLEAESPMEEAAPEVQVRAGHIEGPENPAGKLSIHRSGMERHSGLVRLRLGELEQTVERLGVQLRQLEVGAAGQSPEGPNGGAASPFPEQEGVNQLEPDPVSTPPKLSRDLADTVRDLAELCSSLKELQDESETLLRQQMRIVDESDFT